MKSFFIELFPIKTLVKGMSIKVGPVLRYTTTENAHFGKPMAKYNVIYIRAFRRLLMVYIKVKNRNG